MSEKIPSPTNTPQAPQEREKQSFAILPVQEELHVEAIGGQNIDTYGSYFAEKLGNSLADSLAKYGGFGAVRPVGEWSRFDGKTIKIKLTDEDILDYLSAKYPNPLARIAERVKEIAFAK